MKIQDKILPLVAFLFLILLWEYASYSFEAHQFVLPPPSRILVNIWERTDRFWFHTKITLAEMLGGFILAFTVSFPLAWIMWYWKSACRILQPLFIVTQCIPMFTLAPIMVIWFGWTYTAIVVPTALMIFFPLTMNIFQGFQSVSQHLIDYFKINGATPWQMLCKLQIPCALPYIFAGFRISAAIAGIGAIAGEWAGAQSGLGMLMLESRRATDLETTFGALLILVILSMSLYAIITQIEKQFTYQRYLSSTVKRLAMILASLGLFLGGCASGNSHPQKTRLLLDWLPNPNHIPLYIGIEKNFFHSHGIDIELIKLNDPSDTVPYLSSGQTELALFYSPDAIRSNAHGSDLESVAYLIKKPLNALIFRAGEGIEKPQDLNGKKIGYCIGTSTGLLDYILESSQIKPSEMRNVTFDLVSSLGTKQVDAIFGAYWNIECEHLASLGINTSYFDLTELGVPSYYELIVLAKRGSPQSENGFKTQLQQALQESIDYATLHPEEAFQIYLNANPDKNEKTIQWERQAWYKTYPVLAENQSFDVDVWNRFAAWLYTHDLLMK